MVNAKSNRKVVLVGANGMLGRALAKAFAAEDVIALTHAELDITDRDSVLKAIYTIQPTIILNAAAYTKVDDCETNRELANAINGKAVGYLAEAAKICNATLVHYSTDYIFAGDHADGYTEEMPGNHPVNAYGVSKLLGEQAIHDQTHAHWSNYYILRTAWLFGLHGPNFVDTMLKLGATRPALKVVNDQHGSPTFTDDLAVATHQLIESKQPFGTYHITNAGVCTWYDFATEIFKQANMVVTVEPCSSAEYPRPAKRPTYSVLLNTKVPTLPAWQDALQRYLVARKG